MAARQKQAAFALCPKPMATHVPINKQPFRYNCNLFNKYTLHCKSRKVQQKTTTMATMPLQRAFTALQYYFDAASYECLAFRYHGCGGNGNRFASKSDCWTTCKVQDGGMCAGRNAPLNDVRTGQMIICGNGAPTAQSDCPAGYKCRMGAFFGACCELTNEGICQRTFMNALQ